MRYVAIATAAAAVTVSGPVFSAQTVLTGTQIALCQVETTTENLDFTDSFFFNSAGGASRNQEVFVICNDANGANVRLGSELDGMRNTQDNNNVITYTATLSSGTDVYAELVTLGISDQRVASGTIPPSEALALDGQTVNLDIVLDEIPVFAGEYSDVLQIEVAASL